MSRSSWNTERRTKASIANGDNGSLAGTAEPDEASTLSGGRRATRRTFMSDEIEEDSDDDDDEIDDGLPGAYAISRTTEGGEVIEWDPTSQTVETPDDLSSTSEEGKEADTDGIDISPEEERDVDGIDESEGREADDIDVTEEIEDDGMDETEVINAPVVVGKDTQLTQDITRTHNERKWLIALGSALCVAGVVVVATVVIIVATAKDQQGPPQQTGTFSPPVGVCDYDDQKQVDPFIQCQCDQEITKISVLVQDAYQKIKNFLADGFDQTLSMDSCEPENIALVWASADYTEAVKDGRVMLMERVVTRYALAVLYYTWGGNDWNGRTNWLTRNSECVWFGIGCDENKVTNFTLSEENAGGVLESRLGLLSDLRILSLCSNQMTGSIPLEVWSLPNLEKLLLDHNDIEGTLPASLGEYSTSLKTISLFENTISGTLPSLSGMTQLRGLNLGHSGLISRASLSGTIPESWGELVQLERLVFAHNVELVGSLPSSFSSLTNLDTLVIESTGITGTVPDFIARMPLLKIFSANFGLNAAATIPTFFGSLTNLVVIGLSSCALTGTIPSELALCTKLEDVLLSGNQLIGTLPPEFGELVNLVNFNVDYNFGLSGTIPPEYGELKELRKLNLQETGLSGTVPAEFCEGEVPVEIRTLTGAFSNCDCCIERCPLIGGCQR